jgi:hypothetical protein
MVHLSVSPLVLQRNGEIQFRRIADKQTGVQGMCRAGRHGCGCRQFLCLILAGGVE